MLRKTLALLTLATTTVFGASSPVQAGCGCDKPPPPMAAVRPNATYAGTQVTLFHSVLQSGQTYAVTFRSGTSNASATLEAQAITQRDFADGVDKPQVVVDVPALPLGPTSLQLANQNGTLLSLSDEAFTIVPQPIDIPTQAGQTILAGYQAAVSRNGVVYLSLDVSAIQHPRTFQAQALGYPLRFTNDEIVFYNIQGVMMQLLDEGMPGLYALEMADGAPNSDTLQYARHEFNTYFLQHDERKTHTVDPDDLHWHLDGTRHIDHDHLIIAVAGMLDDGSSPVPGATPVFDLALSSSTFFHHGLVGQTQVELRNKSGVDSYNSYDGSFGAEGDVFSNGTVILRNASMIDGDATAAAFELHKKAAISGEMHVVTQPQMFLPVDIPSGLEDLGSLKLSGNETYRLGPGSYQLADLSISRASTLAIDNIDGPVTLYVTGRVEITDKALVSMADTNPEKFALYVAGDGQVKLTGQGTFYGLVYAPESRVEFKNTAEFFGAFVGAEVDVKNDAHVHYDTALRNEVRRDTEVPLFGEEASLPPAFDSVVITKVDYKNNAKLKIYAESEAGPDAMLLISIAGVVEGTPMTYKANKERYEYSVKTSIDLVGLLVSVTSDRGGTDSAVIK